MLVTINTDASYCQENNIGAYAFWIVCNDFKIKRGGLFKDGCESSAIAEKKAIINALASLGEKQKSHCRVIVNTDSNSAIGIFTHPNWLSQNRKNPTYVLYAQLRKQFEDLTRFFDVEFRHVKAHNGTSDARSYVNDWCDKTAKHYLRKKRKELLCKK